MGYSGLEKIDDLGQDPNVESISFTECFEKACPIFMVYGLTYEDFWFGDPFKAKYQKEAYSLQLRKQDEYMWEQGMYIYEAILEAAPILHPFSKAQKPLPYTEQPHLIKIEKQEQEQRDEQIKENERLKAQIWLRNWARGMKKQMENKDK